MYVCMMYVCIYVRINVCVYVCMYVCTYACVCIYVYMYVFMCHILRAERFFGSAMILSLVREVNSCSSTYILAFSGMGLFKYCSVVVINLQYHTSTVTICCTHRYIKYYIHTVCKCIIRHASVFISGNGLIMDPEMR